MTSKRLKISHCSLCAYGELKRDPRLRVLIHLPRRRVLLIRRRTARGDV